jgi:hypothetical protein
LKITVFGQFLVNQRFSAIIKDVKIKSVRMFQVPAQKMLQILESTNPGQGGLK